MESTGTQQAIATASEQISQPQYTSKMRWVDLGLVLFIGFASPILVSIYGMFVPSLVYARGSYRGLAITDLLLRHACAFLMLAYVFSRQKRRIREIGLGLHWTDLFKAVWLTILA